MHDHAYHHDFARVTNQADCSVVVTKSCVSPFFRLGIFRDFVKFLGHYPLVQIFLNPTVKVSMIPGPLCFRTSPDMLSTPGDLPYFSIRTAFSNPHQLWPRSFTEIIINLTL